MESTASITYRIVRTTIVAFRSAKVAIFRGAKGDCGIVISPTNLNPCVAEFVRMRKGPVVLIKNEVVQKSYDFCYESRSLIRLSQTNLGKIIDGR